MLGDIGRHEIRDARGFSEVGEVVLFFHDVVVVHEFEDDAAVGQEVGCVLGAGFDVEGLVADCVEGAEDGCEVWSVSV